MTIANNGNVLLSDIQLPEISAPLSYISGGSKPCALSGQQLSNQELAKGDSCTVILHYSPTVAQASTVSTFVINATYNGTQSYATNSYGLGLTALAPSALTISPSSLSPSLNWTDSTSYTTSVNITNVGGSNATLGNITSSNPSLISPSGCSESLTSGHSCTLTITGTYPVQTTSYTDNSSITVNYSDAGGGSYSTVININASLAMKPVVTGALGISGSLPVSLTAGTPSTTVITLTNNSAVTNNGDASIKVNKDSLTGSGFIVTNGGGGTVSASLNTSEVSNPCNATSDSITLSPGDSCNVNMVLTASGTTSAGNSSPQVTVKPSYTYNVYNNSSITPSDSVATDVSSPLIQTITVTDPAAALSFSYSPSLIAVERLSTPNPAQATLTVTNVGSATMTSISMPPNISGVTFSGQGGCANLAVNASCNITINVSTNTAISGNLSSSTVLFTDAYNISGQSVNLGGFPYSVNDPSTPNITVSASTNSCSSVGGNGISGSCLLNPSANSTTLGSAGAMRLLVTYTNFANEVAQNFTVTANPPTNYTLDTNNCVGVQLNHNDYCTIVYQISNPTSTSDNLNLIQSTQLDNGYTYQYGSQAQINAQAGPSAPLTSILNVNSVRPSLSLALNYAEMLINISQNISATLSSWYISTTPGNISFSSTVPNVAADPLSCTVNFSGSGGNCNTSINATTNAGNTNITANITAPDGSLSSSPQLLTTALAYALVTSDDTNTTGLVSRCGVYDISRNLANCVSTGNITFKGARETVINNNYAYVVNHAPGGGSIAKCDLSNIDATLSNCISTGSGFNGTINIAFNNGFAYINNYNGNNVTQCTVSGSGILNSCVNVLNITNPQGIAFYSVSGTTYAYIGNTVTHLHDARLVAEEVSIHARALELDSVQ